MIHEDPVCAEPKLFVGGLRFEATREEVLGHFSGYGPIKNCALLTDRSTGKSKGCAMVLFNKWGHAEAAMLAENGTASPLSGARAMIVKFADPQKREVDGVVVGVTPKKLFVGQVAAGITADQIRAIFAPYGEILDLNVMPPKKEGAMGCAFVTYSTWAAAEQAIEGVDGKFTLPGAPNPIAVKLADAKPQDIQRVGSKRGLGDVMAGGPSKRQFMGQGFNGKGAMGYGLGMMGMGMPGMGMMGMGYGMGMGNMMMGGGGMGYGLQGMGGPGGMGAAGQLGAGGGMGGGMGGRDMGTGFGAPGGGADGLGAPGGMLGAGQGMMGAPGISGMGGMGPLAAAGGMDFSSQLQAAKAWKLFVGQVSFTLTEQDLFHFFSQFGTILELVLLRMPDGRSRGCGFLTYSSQAEAEAAIAGANGIIPPNDTRGRPLSLKFAQQKTQQ